MATPLSHLTVVDFTKFRAGPWCTQLLGDLGAEVIKIEHPEFGDPTRHHDPQLAGEGSTFLAINRNKRSVAVDLKDPDGHAIVEELIAEADVLVENFSLGVMERLDLGYERLAAEVNEDLVYASIKGYGESGPYRDRKGVDLVMQAEGGLMSVTGFEDRPVKVGQAIGDIGAGLYSVISVMAALEHRNRTGEGQKVDVDLFGTIVSFLEEYVTRYGMTGEDPEPMGNRHQSITPYELFETRDGRMVLSLVTQDAWETFVTDTIEEESLLEYDSQALRNEHYDEIMDVLRPAMREKTTAEWEEILTDLGIPHGPLNHVSDVVDHPQARARDAVFEYDDPELGPILMNGYPMHFSETDTEVRSGPPRLGADTGPVLSEYLGLSEADLDELRDADVVY